MVRLEGVVMRSFIIAVLCLGLLTGCSREEARTFNNPIIPGSFPDPSIIRVGDDYYTVHSTFEYFPGVPVMHSRDLVNWRLIGYCLTRESQLPLEKMRASGGIYAPTIRYHDGTFYMITTNVDGGGNFYVTAEDPAGPWSDPVWIDSEGIDPSLFFDDDGTVYYTRQEGGRYGFTAQRTLNLATGQLEGPLRKIWEGTGGIWPEGPHLYKIDDWYYLMISEGGTSYDHMVTVARSRSPWGPFESNPDNPILTHRHLPDHPFQAIGHADMVETPDGWWMVILGIRPQGGNYHHIGRETFLVPVIFDAEGWPVAGNNGIVDPVMAAPELTLHPWPPEPARDRFDGDILGLHWNYLRNPHKADYSLSERKGFLRLHGTAVTMTEVDSPTFVGRRQTDLDCIASTLVDFDPRNEDEEAGLVARGNDKHHYQIAVTRKDDKRQILLRKVLQGELAEPLLHAEIGEGPVELSIKATSLMYEFYYRLRDGAEILLGSAPTRGVSVEEIGFEDGMCFTGVYFGVYATGNGRRSETPADFEWFEYVSNTGR
jgi:xylan 1,4-beta-xylosidase